MARLKKSDLDGFVEMAEQKVKEARELREEAQVKLDVADEMLAHATDWAKDIRNLVGDLGHNVED